jgi:6-phosphogluconolactonase (cycloisomerase 2 family)
MKLSPTGRLAYAQGSPQLPNGRIFAEGFPASKGFVLGLALHPSLHLLYISMPTVAALAMYRYNAAGRLQFVSVVPNFGGYLPCWNQVTRDGRWLYTSNADTDNLTAFSLKRPTRPRQFQTVELSGAR